MRFPASAASAFAIALLAAPVAAEDPPADFAWAGVVRRAAQRQAPIIVFSRPPSCPDARGETDSCRDFPALIALPAAKRRLAKFETVVGVVESEPLVTVHDPGGRAMKSWGMVPDILTMSKFLALVEGATPHLIEHHRASAVGDRSGALRARALALLALGDEEQGRAALGQLAESASPEDQQLASIWRSRLDVVKAGADPSEESLLLLTRGGATDRVRYEAFMALGLARLESGRAMEAADAYVEAVSLATDDAARELAELGRSRSLELAMPVLGVGDPRSVTVGKRTLQPRGVRNAARVEYRIDGRLVAVAKHAPFAASVDFGRVPERRTLEVSVFGRDGTATRREKLVVNERSDAASIHIVQPASATISGTTDVVLDARLPRGRTLRRATVEWNNREVAAMTQPPFRTRLTIGDGESGILRAALLLDDGSEAEDVRIINSEELSLQGGVHLVEVPVYLDAAGGRMPQVTVREDGAIRRIDRIVPASDAPLVVGLLLDTSGSMGYHVFDFQEAAIRFVEEHLGDRDRAMVVAFDTRRRVLWPTSDKKRITDAILGLRAKGATALYDSMINALVDLQVTGSRRALVVLTDGLDNGSVFRAADVAEVARRIGVPVYILLFDPPVVASATIPGRRTTFQGPAPDARATRALMQISRMTGGSGFELRSIRDLGRIWTAVGTDLSKQALVVYRSESRKPGWHTLEIGTSGGRVRAPEGVYVSGAEVVE